VRKLCSNQRKRTKLLGSNLGTNAKYEIGFEDEASALATPITECGGVHYSTPSLVLLTLYYGGCFHPFSGSRNGGETSRPPGGGCVRPSDMPLAGRLPWRGRRRSMTSLGHAHFRFGRWAGLMVEPLDRDISGTERDIDARFSPPDGIYPQLRSAPGLSGVIASVWVPGPRNPKTTFSNFNFFTQERFSLKSPRTFHFDQANFPPNLVILSTPEPSKMRVRKMRVSMIRVLAAPSGGTLLVCLIGLGKR
jgi:hypothetical protein